VAGKQRIVDFAIKSFDNIPSQPDKQKSRQQLSLIARRFFFA
jgi:hypothetical protein